MPTWIYGLVCPETGSVRYVGKAVDPHARLASHRSDSAAQGVRRWFSDLGSKGLQPALVLLERVADTESAFAAEREWIARAIRVLFGIPEADWLTAREREVVDAASRRALAAGAPASSPTLSNDSDDAA